MEMCDLLNCPSDYYGAFPFHHTELLEGSYGKDEKIGEWAYMLESPLS